MHATIRLHLFLIALLLLLPAPSLAQSEKLAAEADAELLGPFGARQDRSEDGGFPEGSDGSAIEIYFDVRPLPSASSIKSLRLSNKEIYFSPLFQAGQKGPRY